MACNVLTGDSLSQLTMLEIILIKIIVVDLSIVKMLI